MLSRRVAGARTPVLLYRFTNLKIDCLVVVTLCLRCSSLWICTADKPFFEYSIIKCCVDIDNLLTLPVTIFVYKQCLFISVTWSGEACVRFVYHSFVSCIARSFVSCVRLIKLTNETNEPITWTKRKRTKNEQTIHANETNEKCKRYEISVNLNDPGSVHNNAINKILKVIFLFLCNLSNSYEQ